MVFYPRRLHAFTSYGVLTPKGRSPPPPAGERHGADGGPVFESPRSSFHSLWDMHELCIRSNECHCPLELGSLLWFVQWYCELGARRGGGGPRGGGRRVQCCVGWRGEAVLRAAESYVGKSAARLTLPRRPLWWRWQASGHRMFSCPRTRRIALPEVRPMLLCLKAAFLLCLT